MADLGSLIMSSSFFSRVSILLSAPSDMTAPSLVVKSWVLKTNEEAFPNCLSLHVNPLCSWLMAAGLAEQPLGSQPTQIASNRNGVHNEEKIFPMLPKT